MAMRPNPEPLTKLFQILLLGLERRATPILQSRCEQGISHLSPALPLHSRVSSKPRLGRPISQVLSPARLKYSYPSEALHIRQGVGQSNTCSSWSTQLCWLTWASCQSQWLKLEQQLGGRRLYINKKGNGGFWSAEPEGVATSVSWGKRRGSCAAERWALLLWRKPRSSVRCPALQAHRLSALLLSPDASSEHP